MFEVKSDIVLQATFAGLKIIQSSHILTEELDLSEYRLLSYHKSKLKRYRPKKVLVPSAYQADSTLFIHPKLYAELKLKLANDLEQRFDRMAYSALRGKL